MPLLPLRSYLLLYRTRLIWAAAISVLCALLILFWTTAESPTDFGILWHHFCGCPADPRDTFALLNISSFTCFVIGILLGVGVGTGIGTQNQAALAGSQGMFGEARFLLTRPTRRSTVLLIPALIACTAILLLPAAGLLLLLGWLRLVHAPALGHLVDLVRLVPSTHPLEAHPTFAAVLANAHFASHYLAAVSVGLCGYALFNAPRWTVHSQRKWIRLSSSFIFVIIWLPSLQFFSPFVRGFIFLTPPRPHDLGYLPPLSYIAAHFAFAAAVLYGCWTIARDAEL